MAIFQKMDDFFKEMGLQWKNCIGKCIDGAASMTRHTAGFYSRVRSASDLSVTFTQCMIHREALMAKKFFRVHNTVV